VSVMAEIVAVRNRATRSEATAESACASA